MSRPTVLSSPPRAVRLQGQHAPSAAEVDAAATRVKSLLAKYHATNASRIHVPSSRCRLDGHQVCHAKSKHVPAVTKAATGLTRVQARIDQFKAALIESARDTANSKHDEPGLHPRTVTPCADNGTLTQMRYGVTLESIESFRKAIRCRALASLKTHAISSHTPNKPADKPPSHRAPMAPRAERFHDLDVEPVPFELFPQRQAPRGIQRKSNEKGAVKKTVSFLVGDVEKTVPVETWIGTRQGVETADQLCEEGIVMKGRYLHVHPDPCRIIRSHLVGWSRIGPEEDLAYVHKYGSGSVAGTHWDCTNDGCNRRHWRGHLNY